ncbi:Tof1 [Kluyveromyces lactis]|nr:Tof1 [Kluyveromyces lactis]
MSEHDDVDTVTERPPEDRQNIHIQNEYQDISYTIIKARIGMLATAIGGPDHSVDSVNPPYKVGDDCLACIKDLVRWFKLVDDNQKRWDVEMATAEFKILQNDLIPILLDWEAKNSAAARKSKKTGEDISIFFPNKSYHDRIALGALQLMVLMTWPLIITDQSSYNQVNYYFELKKHQLLYKHAILTTENGKVLKAAIRLALNVMSLDAEHRTARDDSLIRMVLNFLKNVVAIEPGEVTISSVKRLKRPLTMAEMLPTNITVEDISINSVITAFDKNKVFGFLLTVANSLSDAVDPNFVSWPLLEVMFFLTKDINPIRLFKNQRKSYKLGTDHEITDSNMTTSGKHLSELLAKEHEKKLNVIKNTSSRHSRFGGLLSIQTPQNTRLTIASSSVNMRDDAALQELDSRKKWNKTITMRLDVIEGLGSSFFSTEGNSIYMSSDNINSIKEFLADFVDSSFNLLLQNATDSFTSEIQDQLSLHKIEYMLFISWFVKFQRSRCIYEIDAIPDYVSGALLDECYILFTKYLRESYEQKNWPVVHAGMLLFTEYLEFLLSLDQSWEADVQAVISKILSENMLQLLASLPKSATSHSSQYVKACINLTHVVLKTIDKFDENSSMTVESKRKRKVNLNHTAIEKYAKDNDLDYESAFDILEEQLKQVTINFDKVFRGYLTESTISTYIRYLQSYKELEDKDLIRVLKFLQRVFVKAKEELFLFRIDFMILCREILSQQGLPTTSELRTHFTKFNEYYLKQLRNKLKKMPSLYINILFPMLHDSQISYYMRHGKMKLTEGTPDTVLPSTFINIPDGDSLPKSVLLDMQIGILVSSLIDDGYEDLIEALLLNLQSIFDELKSKVAEGINSLDEERVKKVAFNATNSEIKRALYQQPEFRRLLILAGFAIPEANQSACYFINNKTPTEVQFVIETIQKHRCLPFESEIGKPASYYLSSHYQEYEDPEEYGSDLDNGSYFEDLEIMDKRTQGRELSKGKAQSKLVRRSKGKRKAIAQHPEENESDSEANANCSTKLPVVSKEYIMDSDDEDPDFGTIFFENETYLRQLLDKHNGSLTETQFSLFAQFCEERVKNNGQLINDYSALFNETPKSPIFSDVDAGTIIIGSASLPSLANEPIETQVLSSDEYSSHSIEEEVTSEQQKRKKPRIESDTEY